MNFSRFVAKVGKRLGHQRFHAFAVGPGKTGTHSIASMLDDCYRAAHEPDAEHLIPLLIRHGRSQASAAALAEYVRQFHRSRRLEMNASHLNTHLAPVLASEFPRSKFLLLIRDCFTWANSALNQDQNVPTPSAHWIRWRKWEFGLPHQRRYAPEDRWLLERGCAPLSTFFRMWSDHYRKVLASVPPNRLLRVHTHQITTSSQAIAAFLDIPVATVDAREGFKYRAPRDHRLLHQLPPEFVNQLAAEHCGDLMRLFYPDTPLEVGYYL